MNDWFRKMWCKVFFDRDSQYKPRKVDVEALIAALDALDGDPITSGFSVSKDDGRSYMTTTDVVFAGVSVARKVLSWTWGDSYLTEAGEALGDDMIQLMQVIIDKHQAMKTIEAAERAAVARKALDEAKAVLAARRSEISQICK